MAKRVSQWVSRGPPTFEIRYEGHCQALPGDLLLEAGGICSQGHRAVLLHLDLLNRASRTEGAEVQVLARRGAGHEVAEAGVAGPLTCVLLQLLARHHHKAESTLGHQQLPGEVVQLHRQLEDVPGHLQVEGLPIAVVMIQAAWKRELEVPICKVGVGSLDCALLGIQAGLRPESGAAGLLSFLHVTFH